MRYGTYSANTNLSHKFNWQTMDEQVWVDILFIITAGLQFCPLLVKNNYNHVDSIDHFW